MESRILRVESAKARVTREQRPTSRWCVGATELARISTTGSKAWKNLGSFFWPSRPRFRRFGREGRETEGRCSERRRFALRRNALDAGKLWVEGSEKECRWVALASGADGERCCGGGSIVQEVLAGRGIVLTWRGWCRGMSAAEVEGRSLSWTAWCGELCGEGREGEKPRARRRLLREKVANSASRLSPRFVSVFT